MIKISFYAFKQSAIYYDQPCGLIDLSAFWLISLVIPNVIRRNILFLLYMSYSLYRHNLKVSSYFQSIYMLSHGIALLNASRRR